MAYTGFASLFFSSYSGPAFMLCVLLRLMICYIIICSSPPDWVLRFISSAAGDALISLWTAFAYAASYVGLFYRLLCC